MASPSDDDPGEPRGQALLLPADAAALADRGLAYEATFEAGTTCIVLTDYALPAGLVPATVDVLIRLPGLWPDAKPDMFWTDPAVRRTATNAYPPSADQFESYLGRTWQRWSRHINTGWRGGIDDLGSFLAIIAMQIARAAG